MIAGTGKYLVCGSMRVTEYQEPGCSRGWTQQLETNVGWQMMMMVIMTTIRRSVIRLPARCVYKC